MAGWAIASVIFWAWFWPHEFGKWIEQVKDPYRQKPVHQKK